VTEAEWVGCQDATAMLRLLRGKAGERKLRLLACACARFRWSGLVEPEYRRAVEVAERVADGLDGLQDLRAAEFDLWCLGWVTAVPPAEAAADAHGAAAATVEDFAPHAAEKAIACLPRGAVALVREIFDPPWREVFVDPLWLAAGGGRLIEAARRAYEEYRFEELPHLADLLTEAGCRDEGLLAHLRSTGPHFRGCWALDAVLGKGQGKDPVTDADWAGDTQPFRLISWWQHFRGEPSPRKRRLLACACCRLIWGQFTDECLRRAVELAEGFADGRVGPGELARAHEQAVTLATSRGKRLSQMSKDNPQWAGLVTAWRAASAAAWASGPDGSPLENALHDAAQDGGRGRDTEDAGQAALVQDILGNPLRPAALDPAWLRGGGVQQLARAIYDVGRYEDLPVLADALEDAGCTAPEILGHLRGPGPHVRGCWVLDLALGKE
jgi:hypothetical protein